MTRFVLAFAVLVVWAPFAAAQSRSGPYLGADAGFLAGRADVDLSTVQLGQRLRFRDSVPFDGVELGAFAGGRLRLGRVHLGLELGGSVGGVSGRTSQIIDFAQQFGGAGELRREREVTLALKLGAEVVPGTLVYAIGGIQGTQFTFDLDGPGIRVSEEGFLPGAHVGIGVEQTLSPRLALRAEVTSYQWSSLTTSRGPLDIRVDPTERALRVGLAWFFF
jgi:opacity protein-like surface antigen